MWHQILKIRCIHEASSVRKPKSSNVLRQSNNFVKSVGKQYGNPDSYPLKFFFIYYCFSLIQWSLVKEFRLKVVTAASFSSMLYRICKRAHKIWKKTGADTAVTFERIWRLYAQATTRRSFTHVSYWSQANAVRFWRHRPMYAKASFQQLLNVKSHNNDELSSREKQNDFSNWGRVNFCFPTTFFVVIIRLSTI